MQLSENFNHSYWELKQYFKSFDLIIIGSGIVGLSAAISYKQKHKKSNVLILERGIFPNGASTKNAGFACFGSVSELLDDMTKTSEKTVFETVEMRWKGLQLLRKRLGDKHLAFKSLGGYELFNDQKKYQECLEKINYLNKEIAETLGIKNCYANFTKQNFGFKNIHGLILNKYEGQIDTGLMMQNLTIKAQQNGVVILSKINISRINDLRDSVELESDLGVFKATKVIVATNGFAKQLLNLKDVKPARAQVLVTQPIKNLKIKGTFHYEEGYYYFRNIDNRILFGGGRNLDVKGETTTEMGLNASIQKRLDYLLKEMILPDTTFEIAHRWSGIMGVGNEKKPILQFVSKNVFAAVRMGGMGVAIGSWVGEQASSAVMD